MAASPGHHKNFSKFRTFPLVLGGRATSWDPAKTSGRFVISGLAPGDYLIRVDAYDGPTPVGSTGKIINMGFFDGDELGPRRDFGYRRDDVRWTATAGDRAWLTMLVSNGACLPLTSRQGVDIVQK